MSSYIVAEDCIREIWKLNLVKYGNLVLIQLFKVIKEESGKVGLKLNIQKIKIMASGPITSWGNRWGNSGNSVRLYFFQLKNHCRW